MPGVQPYINSNDRGPSWDGNIYISLFDDGSKKNLSKIPTQIKGHREDAKGKQEISFPEKIQYTSLKLLNRRMPNGTYGGVRGRLPQ